ncbi:hypothetical protein EC957_008758 [Mortierella hygrophila]|uniref:Uncharacterized protein n=1 Tax=Mortierella hygrophila TaxID=979708 RepID=A0A9P6FCG0_9FUNG|nr:hypothetical protein EC957_008758 [Mortierella hygrophila]
MHLVHISNRKLNREVFSSRDRSIHRRIVIKNFLTMLYQLHPVEWIKESSVAIDDQDQWLEQTLSAAGIDSQDEADDVDTNNDHTDSHHNESQGLAILSPSAAAAASVVTSRRRLSLRSNKVPLPRPASVELSQSLHSYLSAVFDVNWSVSQSSNTEDSFVTAPSSNPSSSSSPSGSGSSSRSQAISARRPTLGQRMIESLMEPEQDNVGGGIARRHQGSRQEASSLSSPQKGLSKNSNGRSTDINYKADESHQMQRRQSDSRPDTGSSLHQQPQQRQGSDKKMAASTSRAGPESRTQPPRPSTSPPRPSTPPPSLASKKTLLTTTTTKTPEKYAPPRPERPSSPSAMPYTLSFDPDPSLSLQSNYAMPAAVYEPISMTPQQHIHNHIHIHVHNYPPEAAAATTTTLSTSPPQRSVTPPPRSSRYPKPPPPRPTTTTTTTTTTTEYISYSTDYSASIHSQWATPDPKAILAATAAAAANLPPTWQPVSSESLLPSTVATISRSSYPPEKSAGGLMNGRGVEEEVGEEQPYLAMTPPTTSRYLRSPPPPPYTQSPIDQSSFAAPLSPSMSPTAFSPFEAAYASKQQQSVFTPILTAQPQSTLFGSTSASANQKLLEYKLYQERQKMFARGDDSEKDESSKLDGLGFIRRLSRQSSKKKNPLASISAPLPSTLSYSSSSASSMTSLSVAVPLHTIGGGLERYHDDYQQQSSSQSKGLDAHGSPRYSLQPAAKNAVSMFKGTLSSVKSGLSRSSSPTPPVTSSIGPIGPQMTMSSSALTYGADNKVSCLGPSQVYHYPTPSTSASPTSATLTTTVL